MGGDHVTASVIIVNYNGMDDLDDCLRSVCGQDYESTYEVIVVDNDSTDGSVGFVRENFPDVRVVENATNRWFTGGVEDGIAAASGEYLVVLNPDVAVDPDWLRALLAPFTEEEGVGLTTSRIVQFDAPSRLNTCGNSSHYTGLGFCRGLDAPADDYPDREDVPAISGCSFAIPRRVYDDIGGLDESFEMYLEDMDLSWRARLAGYRIVYVPDSVVYHKYDLSLPSWKLRMYERNRYLLLSKHLEYRTLLLLLPGLLLTEVLVWMYALKTGSVSSKASAWWWLLRHREQVREKRRSVQALRRRSDHQFLSAMTVRLPVEQFDPPAAGLLRAVSGLAYLPWYYLCVLGRRSASAFGRGRTANNA